MNEDMTIEQARDERRFRAVAIPEHRMVEIFKGGCYLKSDLPEDIKVDMVHHDQMRRSWVVTLVSVRFEPVAPSYEIPIEDGVETFYLEHIDNEEG